MTNKASVAKKIPRYTLAFDAVDKRRYRHVQRCKQHQVKEDVLKEKNDAVSVVDDLDVVVKSVVATGQTFLDHLSVQDISVLNFGAFGFDVGSHLPKIFGQRESKLKKQAMITLRGMIVHRFSNAYYLECLSITYGQAYNYIV